MNTFTLTYRCPDLASQEDAVMLQELLSNEAGVGEVDVDWRTKMVKVTTASQDGGKSVYAALLNSGFPPED